MKFICCVVVFITLVGLATPRSTKLQTRDHKNWLHTKRQNHAPPEDLLEMTGTGPSVVHDEDWKLSWTGGQIGLVYDSELTPDNNFLWVMHRGTIGEGDYDENMIMLNPQPIPVDVLLKCYVATGECIESFGTDMFYFPHGLSLTPDGSKFLITDTGTHQIMVLDVATKTVEKVIGEMFIPGNDATHFCRPTDMEYDDVNKLYFVADGVCNSRIAVFDLDFNLVSEISGCQGVPFNEVHDLAFNREARVMAAADRNGKRVCMYDLDTFEDLGSIHTGRIYGVNFQFDPKSMFTVQGIEGYQGSGSVFLDNGYTVYKNKEMMSPHYVTVLNNKHVFVSEVIAKGNLMKFDVQYKE